MSSPPTSAPNVEHSSDVPPERAYTIWPSLLLSAILAVLAPTQWIGYADRLRSNWFNFHPLVLVVYVPLAFGLFWPIFVWLHTLAVPALPTARTRRIKTAIAIFVISMLLAAPCVFFEFRSLRRLEAEHQAEANRQKQMLEKEQADRLEAARRIRSDGVLAFQEPLSPAQSWALTDYMVLHPVPDCLEAANQYRASIVVLLALAKSKSCPAPALQFMYDTAVSMRAEQKAIVYPDASYIFYAVATNPGSPPKLLVQLLDSDLYGVRVEAARNPSTPKREKIAYLRSCVARLYADREYAAGDRDTPPEVLEQLASEPNFIGALASNPSTPISVVKRIADTSDNMMVRDVARRNLAERGAQ